ncbi:metallo-beta-lactamase superfamily protein [Pseudomonas sp. FH4]|jgi:glyoxylase-like metal-dependent hydrolase (beta-lactamase superfamily II)|uniref:Glyoxylase, beta-lactamase superfamily II n=1 Tax=Pseudomonas brenneri TaxID=129817 RepID=A0A5B2UYF4_9PSED|nr:MULTISPECIES: MBL fold metallo-hydrolase [Pseudomonas fluorescens group]KAA6168606.1 MBL fold metallo-hydrolase [Pseudomonas marginalis]MBU0939488.1 MBL fold metallo-hydrolase [Gammaproteobacteria bacterium]ETK18194.1 metallo-beta-lactamase superfamily protein [Pseudomonas sp. FH4]KAA2231781.1 MBL fold metallo-hydrolase [Pseudomonas brenneri]MBF8007169.1 MBL fold metallo-hydrolase [Pseudomonas brenneri]
MSALIQPFLDEASSTWTYIVYEADGGPCAIVDSVLDYDPASGRTSTAQAERLVAFVVEHRLQVQWLLETHAHADHLSAAPYLRRQLGGKIAIGQSISKVQDVFKNLFNLEPEFRVDGSQFDHLFAPNEIFHIGQLKAQALHVPGHTPADMAYLIDDQMILVGDTLFMPDVGTARCDFPGGDAHQLYASMRKLLAFPDDTRLYVCHDYPPQGRPAKCLTTVAEQRAGNIHVHDGVDEAAFVQMRTTRDAGLGMPTLLLPAIQVNVRAGHMPPAEDNGVVYLKIPLNQL